jgi:hypothetical protein
MAKKVAKKRRVLPPPAKPIFQPEVVNPLGETQPRKVVRSKIRESEFTLSDGTKLVLKPLIGDVRRAVGQYNAVGHPVYFLTIGNSLEAKPPKTLMRKIPKAKSSSK